MSLNLIWSVGSSRRVRPLVEVLLLGGAVSALHRLHALLVPIQIYLGMPTSRSALRIVLLANTAPSLIEKAWRAAAMRSPDHPNRDIIDSWETSFLRHLYLHTSPSTRLGMSPAAGALNHRVFL